MGSNDEHHFKSNHNIVYSCKYHVVWCPKYRRKVLVNGVDVRLKEIIHRTAQEFQATVIELEVMPDHVHLLCEVDPQFGIHRLVRYLKGRSSRLLRQEFPWLRSRLPTLWTNSYFVATVGGAPLAVVKQYQTVVWKQSAIHRMDDGKLILSNGKNAPSLILPLPAEYLSADICKVELTWRADHYELCLTLDTGQVNPPKKQVGLAAGVDLGEVNIASVTTEQGDTLVITGRALRSVTRQRNKRQAAYQSRIDRCKPGSKRQKQLMRQKSRSNAKFKRQQRDILHKASRQVVAFCDGQGVRDIHIGDVRDIQNGVDLGTKTNQKVSQWPHGQFVGYVAYKAAECGMGVVQIPEDYSTRTCSECTHVLAHAPRGRIFRCPGCGAIIHRDANGSANICSRGRYGAYGKVQVKQVTYLRPLQRIRCGGVEPLTQANVAWR